MLIWCTRNDAPIADMDIHPIVCPNAVYRLQFGPVAFGQLPVSSTIENLTTQQWSFECSTRYRYHHSFSMRCLSNSISLP